MSLRLPPERETAIKRIIENISNKTSCTIREFARFIGSLVACCPAVKYGWLYSKRFERLKYLALLRTNNDYKKFMTIPCSLRSDFEWWKAHITDCSTSFVRPQFVRAIFTDASLSGWGAFCNGAKTHGLWAASEQELHINHLELLAVLFGLKCFAHDLADCDILLRIDNTTAISYINRMGGIRFENLTNISRQIWQWCESRNIWLYASYISSSENKEADAESRRKDTEYELNAEAYAKITERFGVPDIDLFASRINAKCPLYISWVPDPDAIAVDAFTISWNDYFFYAFPPFSVILNTLQKICAEQGKGILVVPDWPSQPWYPLFYKLLISQPLKLEPSVDLLLFNRSPHPLCRTLSLIAGIVSGTPSH